MIKKTLLPNNITFVSQILPDATSVSTGFFFSTGSRYEKTGEFGISHFTEHLLFKGTSTRSTHDIACAFDRLGGSVNAFTEKDTVCAYSVVPALEDSALVSLDILCDMAENCTFPKEELERERGVVQSEIQGVSDDAEESAMEKVAVSVWKDQSLGRPIAGNEKDLEALTREKILLWYEENFKKGELLVVACGAFSEEAFINRLSKMGPHKASVSYPQAVHYKEKNVWHKCTSFIKSSFTQCQLYTLYPFSMPLSYQDYLSLLVFNSVMGESMSSRLFESLREKSGLCYSVYSFFTCYEDSAFWAAGISCDKKKVPLVVRKLREEILRVTEDLSEEEIEAAKSHLCGEEYLGGSDPEFLVRRHQRNLAMGFPLMETEEILGGIRKVSKNAIISLIKKTLSEENRSFVYYGPHISSSVKKECI